MCLEGTRRPWRSLSADLFTLQLHIRQTSTKLWAFSQKSPTGRLDNSWARSFSLCWWRRLGWRCLDSLGQVWALWPSDLGEKSQTCPATQSGLTTKTFQIILFTFLTLKMQSFWRKIKEVKETAERQGKCIHLYANVGFKLFMFYSVYLRNSSFLITREHHTYGICSKINKYSGYIWLLLQNSLIVFPI